MPFAPAVPTARRPRQVPVSRRGPHWRLRPLAVAGTAALVAVLLLAVERADARVLLLAPPAVGAAAAAVLRRRDWLEGPVLHVRRVRHRTVDLRQVRRAHVRSVPAADCRVLLLVLVDPRGREVRVPVWRTRSPRGVDAFACDALADRLTSAPPELLALLRAQGAAVRRGARPTPLDRLTAPHPRTRRTDLPATSTAPVATSPAATSVPGRSGTGAAARTPGRRAGAAA